MAVNHLFLCPTTTLSFSFPRYYSPHHHHHHTSVLAIRKRSRLVVCLSSNSSTSSSSSKFKEFPYVSEQQKALMLDLVSMVETRRLSSSSGLVEPYRLPPDVEFYQNPTGTSQAALQVTSGTSSSPVDLMLGSWIHSKLPSGGALDITSLFAYLKPTTDAPIFLFETIQTSPTSFVLVIDLPPRKDLVLHPDYLKTFYEDTNLDKYRQSLENLPEVKTYIIRSLYIRALVSPSAVLVRVDTLASGGETRAEQIIRDHVAPIAREIMKTWLDFVCCAAEQREMDEAETTRLSKRDKIIKNQALEIDLGSTFPGLFGQEVTDRVLGVLREIYNT